jgi:hypothetical protein
MFENFQPFLEIQKNDFVFTPSRYEIWMGGRMIKNGNSPIPIIAKVINIDNSEKIEITYTGNHLHDELALKNVFDLFVTAVDRLQLITIPEQTNSENMGIHSLKSVFGPTRKKMNFNRNEPYCCNLFIENGEIAKLTFSFSSPEKLLEFYI